MRLPRRMTRKLTRVFAPFAGCLAVAILAELSAVLGVDEKTAISIVQRRTDRRFNTAADLEAVPGVDKERIKSIAPRLLFDRPPEDQ